MKTQNDHATGGNRRIILILLAAINVMIIIVMQSVGQDLKPGNMIAFEFAGTIDEVQQMIGQWQKAGVMEQLFFLIGFDYLFMLAYSSFLWLACLTIAGNLRHKSSKILVFIAWLQPAAAFLDVIENLALYKLASGSVNDWWPVLSIACAAPKFVFVLVGLVTCMPGGIYAFLLRK